MQVKDNRVYPGIIEEYSALRKSIEGDKNLLAILKKTSDTPLPGKANPSDEPAVLTRFEGKILADEKRLKETMRKHTLSI